MHDEQHETDARTEPQDARAEWVAPALTDLGSFAELTKLSTGASPDVEGTS